jgi:hypothetical protein
MRKQSGQRLDVLCMFLPSPATRLRKHESINERQEFPQPCFVLAASFGRSEGDDKRILRVGNSGGQLGGHPGHGGDPVTKAVAETNLVPASQKTELLEQKHNS